MHRVEAAGGGCRASTRRVQAAAGGSARVAGPRRVVEEAAGGGCRASTRRVQAAAARGGRAPGGSARVAGPRRVVDGHGLTDERAGEVRREGFNLTEAGDVELLLCVRHVVQAARLRCRRHWLHGTFALGGRGLLGSCGALALGHANESSRAFPCDHGHGAGAGEPRTRASETEFARAGPLMISDAARGQQSFCIHARPVKAHRGWQRPPARRSHLLRASNSSRGRRRVGRCAVDCAAALACFTMRGRGRTVSANIR